MIDPLNYNEKVCAAEAYSDKDIYFNCLYQSNTMTKFVGTVEECVKKQTLKHKS